MPKARVVRKQWYLIIVTHFDAAQWASAPLPKRIVAGDQQIHNGFMAIGRYADFLPIREQRVDDLRCCERLSQYRSDLDD